MTGRVTVVGAGVVGLSCAVRLAETGAEVNVLARDLPLETTSAVAAGLWLPYLCEPFDDVVRWGHETMVEFSRLAAADGDSGGGRSGVRLLPGTLLHRTGPVPEPAWSRQLPDAVTMTPVHQPAPGYAFGHRLTVPVADMPRYLQYLTDRLRAAGGTLTRMPLSALPTRGVVVNCTGVSARALAADPAVRPVRGQVALLADPGLTDWWCDESPEHLTYVVPRVRDVVVGGTLDDGDWDVTPDDDTARRLIGRAVELVPALRGARVLGHRAGLRPSRPVVRLEVERRPTGEDADHVRVHCYGHGGSGVTLSWGCAGEVTALEAELLAGRARRSAEGMIPAHGQ